MENDFNKQGYKSMMISSYGDEKLSKDKELNSSMSIRESQADEYTRAIRGEGGIGND